MNTKIFLAIFIAIAVAACSHSKNEGEKHDEHEGLEHNEAAEAHEDVKLKYTAYSSNFELFAEADAFVVGKEANVLSHFSSLPSFCAVEKGKIILTLTISGKEYKQTLNEPTRKGIYSFDIKPDMQGKGQMKFEIFNDKGSFAVIVPDVTVYQNMEEAHEAFEKINLSKTNTTIFTKEQSWKIEFATALPKYELFGQVIKTTALVEAASGNETVLIAKTNGIVSMNSNNMLEGMNVSAGQSIFTIASNNFSDNNISVKYAEAKSNFQKEKADFERASELAKDKIVSEKDLRAAKNRFENTKAVFDNLKQNFNVSGQTIKSPMSGYIKQLFVKNGSYVELGQPVAVVSQNKTVVLTANLPQKHSAVLPKIVSANIRNVSENKTYTFADLNAKILSFGKAASADNYLIPIYIQIDNKANFTAGSFVELYLKTTVNAKVIVLPNTALLEEQGTYFVWVQITPELFEKREVIPGATDGASTEIKKGALITDRIVTKGAMLIKLAQATGTLDAHSGHVH